LNETGTLNLGVVLSAVFASERHDDDLSKVRDRRQKKSGRALGSEESTRTGQRLSPSSSTQRQGRLTCSWQLIQSDSISWTSRSPSSIGVSSFKMRAASMSGRALALAAREPMEGKKLVDFQKRSVESFYGDRYRR
jgi:hypothetical protein